MEAHLKIIKTLSGDDISYTFVYWSDIHSPISATQNIKKELFDGFKESICAIQDHIVKFIDELKRDAIKANEDYKVKTKGWLNDISEMVREEFLPNITSEFAKEISKLEELSKNGENIFLTIISNDYLVPWWLSKSYSSEDREQIWSRLFMVGFFPEGIDSKPLSEKKGSRIALISRPSNDLRNATDISTAVKGVGKIDVYDGKQKPLGRFGLSITEIEKALLENQILLYYGHFVLEDGKIDKSYLEALQKYPAGRRESEVPSEKITLESIKEKIRNKVVFFDACRSIGLPSLLDNQFPRVEDVLPGFYVNNKIICIGTIYPIFDDAAAEFMIGFINALLADKVTLGECLRNAQKVILKDTKRFDFFDWAPYILIGNPKTIIITDDMK